MVDGWVRFKNKIFEIAAYGCYFFVERMDTKLNLPTTVTLPSSHPERRRWSHGDIVEVEGSPPVVGLCLDDPGSGK